MDDVALHDLHQTCLYRRLIALDKTYAERIDRFVSGISDVLASIRRQFPYYTRHDSGHGAKVTGRMAQIVDPRCLESGSERQLNAPSLFLLIASAYAHDLGMAIFPGEEPALNKRFGISVADDPTNALLTAYLRKEHSKRGGDYIFKHATALGVPFNLTEPLNLMMRSHNLRQSEFNRELAKPFAAAEEILDVRQLSVILCVADAIEFGDNRVHDGVVEALALLPGEEARFSFVENRKHECVFDSLVVLEHGQILVSGSFDDPEVLARTHATLDDIEYWLRFYCDVDRESQIRRLKIRPEPFARRLELAGARFERLGVRMSKRSVIDLIASNAVWRQQEGAAVQELIQNAVEACRYRRFHSSQADGYEPRVTVSFIRDKRLIVVEDNGCGMTESVVLNNLLTVGASRSKEPAYAHPNYDSIARFGVGFWSVFTVANLATVETSAFERIGGSAGTTKGFGFDVELRDLKDYTVFKPHHSAPGTRITLALKADVVLDNVYQDAIDRIVCCEIPLTFLLDGEQVHITRSLPAIGADDLFGARRNLREAQGFRPFVWEGQSETTQATVAFSYRLADDGPHFSFDQPDAHSASSVEFGMTRFSVCGFVVPARPAHSAFAVERIGRMHVNALSPRGFSFGLDRQSLTDNPARRALIGSATAHLHDACRAFLKQNDAYRPEIIYRLNTESELNGGNVYDTYTSSELMEARDGWGDLLCFELLEVVPTGEPPTPIYVNLMGLLALQGTVSVAQTLELLPKKEFPGARVPEKIAHTFLYRFAQKAMAQGVLTGPHYVLTANRAASMLFDGDPEAEIRYIALPIGPDGPVAGLLVQSMTISRLVFDPAMHNVISQVQGRWTGAVYVRLFATNVGRPYVLLGRHRVVLQPDTALHRRVVALADAGRLRQIASLVHDLTLADAGVHPASLDGLL